MLAVQLQGLDNRSESLPLPDDFLAELLPTAISHGLLQPPRRAIMNFSHGLELSHSVLKASLEDSVIDQDLSRHLRGNLYNVPHVHQPGSDVFTQAECPTEREKGREGLVDNSCLSFLDPVGQHYFLVTAQKVLREKARFSRVTGNSVIH